MDQIIRIATSAKKAAAAKAAASRPHRLVRNLAWIYGSFTLIIALLLSMAFWPIEALPRLRAFASESIAHGLGAIVLSSLMLTTTVLLAVLVMTAARRQLLPAEVQEEGPSWLPQSLSQRLAGISPQVAARQGQALILFLGTALTGLATWLLWPATYPPGNPEAGANLLAGVAFALSFVTLVAERIVKEFPAPQLPEAPGLRRLLLLVTVILLAAGCFQVAHGVGLAWVRWPTMVVAFLPWLIAAEF